MKLAILADSFLYDETTGVNGTQVQCYNLAAAFACEGIEVHYLAMTKDDKRPATERDRGIIIHWIGSKNYLFGYLSVNKSYLSLLDEIKPDVLYNRGRSLLTYTAVVWARKNRKRMIWGSNGEDSCEFWKRIDRLRRSSRPIWKKTLYLPHEFLLDTLIHKGVRGAYAVVNQTDYQKLRLKENYGKDGLVLPSYFLPVNTGPSVKQRKVLWLANLAPGKQPEVFLQLANRCCELNNWTFVLGGGSQDQGYKDTIRNRAKEIPNLLMEGAIPFAKSNYYYQSAMLYVNTSEGFADGVPNAMLQAWLNEVPVASLNHDPNGWITRHSLGYCARGDEAALGKWTLEILSKENHLREMGKHCRSFAERQFSNPETIQSYLRLFCSSEKQTGS